MSRSFRKTAIFSNAATSDKQDKRKANRKFRRATKVMLELEREEELPTDIKEVSNVWNFAKDGKGYWSYYECEDDENLKEYHKRAMRK